MVAQINKKLIKYNLHTHSDFCDGSSQLFEYVQMAKLLRFQQLGFSSHAPLKFENNFSILLDKLPEYIKIIDCLKEDNYTDLAIFAGLECDYIPSFSYPFSKFRNEYNLDYIIGGVHLVENPENQQLWFIDGPKRETFDEGLFEIFQGDIQKAVKQYFYQLNEMIQTQDFEILAHLDKIKMHNANRFFSENDIWYKNLCLEVIDHLAQKEIIVEINTRGIYKGRCPDFYPSDFILKLLLKNNIGVTISSDAHRPEELNLMLDEAMKHLINLGFKEVWYFNEFKQFSSHSLM